MIRPTLIDGVVIRRARKAHHCNGDYDRCGKRRVRCAGGEIRRGELYVEWLGESGVYQSGARYHLGCAVNQGLVMVVQ